MNHLQISERVSVLRPTAVNQVLDEVRQLQASGRKLVSLMRGQPDSPTPLHIVESAVQSLRAGRTGYADNQGEPSLRTAVAEKLRREQGVSFDADREILITDGATCGISIALAATLNPGDEVLVPDPIYDAYASPISIVGGCAVPVRADICDGRYTLDADALAAACTSRSRALLLNHPWNPVGTVFSENELQQVAHIIVQRNLTLISDEIYESLIYDDRKFTSAATIRDLASRTIVVNSLSKTYAMTGWRVGYCAAPAHVARAMLLSLQQFSRGPATFVQDAAVTAISQSQDCVRQLAREYQARRDLVVERLQGLHAVRPLVPDGGLFVMVDMRELLERSPGECHTSDDVRRFLLQEHGLVVLHGGAYGRGGEGMLRVSFASGGANLERGLELLANGLKQLASGN